MKYRLASIRIYKRKREKITRIKELIFEELIAKIFSINAS